jgi:L-arabinokinase
VAGALTALAEEWGVWPERGLNLLLSSSVPEGKGVSSSAAIEVAALHALAELFGVRLEPVRAALACQKVENLVVGAPCGVMDQMTASCGAEGQLLPLVCQPATLEPCFPLPDGLALWGIDSGLRHQVSGADYGQVRVAAFMGYRIIADLLGLAVETLGDGRVRVSDEVLAGYVANVPLERFTRELEPALPELLLGRDFLERYAGITDPVTSVRPEASYRVRAATAHPVREHRRAAEFRRLMQGRVGPSEQARLGALMAEAHASYSACGLGSTGTDRIVELVRAEGVESGLHGAKITGGGSGGTVAVLGSQAAEPALTRVVRRYAEETGQMPRVFRGSSPGAAAHGVVWASFQGEGWRLDASPGASAASLG